MGICWGAGATRTPIYAGHLLAFNLFLVESLNILGKIVGIRIWKSCGMKTR